MYHFHERDNHSVKLTFPAIYSYTLPAYDKRPILYVNDPSVGVEWANDFEIRMTLKVPEVRKTLVFNILAYTDSY